MFKYISFFIRNGFAKITSFILSLIIHRSSKIILLTCSPLQSDKFLHNSKYLYLYLENNKNLNYIPVWICNSNQMRQSLHAYGFNNVFTSNSLYGIYYILKAKYWFTDFQFLDTCKKYLFGSSVRINLWHGIPQKKIQFDDDSSYGFYHKLNKFVQIIYNTLRFNNDSYYVVNGEYEKECFKTAFLVSKDNLPILGSPRLDVLLNDIPNSTVFMEEDFKNIKSMYDEGKKIFIYMPTFRDTGVDISGWLKSDKLKQFLEDNNTVLVCKLHPFDKNSLDFELDKSFYKMDCDSDVYPILKYTDALITDYSSVAFDYLLLDKPIIYHVPDLQEYQDTCRGFYMPYEDFAVGEKTENNSEIITAMQNVIDGVDNYKEQRKALRDRMFKYHDGKNCERVVEWIRSLDK